jgi:hypothetical protein
MTDAREAAWPALPFEASAGTRATLHRWFQIVGKIRLAQTPPINHSWHVTLYLTPRGLTTGPIPFEGRTFELEFDFVEHRLTIRTSSGASGEIALEPRTVADFYRALWTELGALGLDVRISMKPNEVPDPEAIPFDRDREHDAYDAEFANRFWRALTSTDLVMRRFRSSFIGKCSPIHFFWGAPDLATTRFSGRTAPMHPGGIPNLPDSVTREAYSHEEASCGFWWGGGPIAYPAFYAYAYPEPPGYADALVRPGAAFYSQDLKEFILPYDAVRTADSPEQTLLDFFQSTYEAAADLGKWDRAALERGVHV